MASFAVLFVGDKIVHNSYNEIKFYNFIAQAKDLNIITKKDDFNCDIIYKLEKGQLLTQGKFEQLFNDNKNF